MKNKKLKGILVDFKEANKKSQSGHVSIVCTVACDDGKDYFYYVNNVKLTNSGKWSVPKGSNIAKLYRLAIGRNDKQVYSDARRIFTALKTQQVQLDCEVELKKNYWKIKAMEPVEPVLSDIWDEAGALRPNKSSVNQLCFKSTVDEALKGNESIRLKFEDKVFDIELSDVLKGFVENQNQLEKGRQEMEAEFEDIMQQASTLHTESESKKKSKSFLQRVKDGEFRAGLRIDCSKAVYDSARSINFA